MDALCVHLTDLGSSTEVSVGMKLFHSVRLVAALLVAATLSGCGESGPKMAELFPVTGTVNMDGQPLADGVITLDPAAGNGVPAMGGIKDGKFNMEAAAGTYFVRFSATEITSEKDEYGEPVSRSLIGDEFNANSTIGATIEKGPNTLTFEIKGMK